jgi:hypothetical protein
METIARLGRGAWSAQAENNLTTEQQMTARDSFYTSLSTNHNTAEHAGVSNLAGAPSLPGNATVMSRDVARAALVAGQYTQSQFNQALLALLAYEQAQNSLAKATLRGTGDNAPV